MTKDDSAKVASEEILLADHYEDGKPSNEDNNLAGLGKPASGHLYSWQDYVVVTGCLTAFIVALLVGIRASLCYLLGSNNTIHLGRVMPHGDGLVRAITRSAAVPRFFHQLASIDAAVARRDPALRSDRETGRLADPLAACPYVRAGTGAQRGLQGFGRGAEPLCSA